MTDVFGLPVTNKHVLGLQLVRMVQIFTQAVQTTGCKQTNFTVLVKPEINPNILQFKIHFPYYKAFSTEITTLEMFDCN
jgi:hypothetical protein